jgi:preprotein translocase subunit SecG
MEDSTSLIVVLIVLIIITLWMVQESKGSAAKTLAVDCYP